MRVVISSESLNSYGTWIKSDGIDLTQYKRNPILLWMHQRGVAIGTVTNLQLENNVLTGELLFDEVREESRIAKAQMEAGTLKMVSPGFSIMEMSDNRTLVKPGQKCKTVTKCVLNEVSVVDIGGNNDNMVLHYEGKTLELTAGGSSALPELTNYNAQKEDMVKILLALGLSAEATEAEAIREITLLRGHKTQSETLKTELETLKLVGITAQVDGAIKLGKITADKKGQFLELGKKLGGEELQSLFDSMQEAVRPMDLIKTGAGGGTGAYKKLSDVPADQFDLIRKNSPEVYATLYKAEFGCDCPDLKSRNTMEV
ncbi:MAG: HK97 family phage prohead protease [Phocaeicola sp.]